MSSLRDRYQEFLDSNAIILGVSTDNAESHKKFIDHLKLPFSLLADTQHDLVDKYNSAMEFGGKTFAKRTITIVDINGLVRFVDNDYQLGSEDDLKAVIGKVKELERIKADEEPAKKAAQGEDGEKASEDESSDNNNKQSDDKEEPDPGQK